MQDTRKRRWRRFYRGLLAAFAAILTACWVLDSLDIGFQIGDLEAGWQPHLAWGVIFWVILYMYNSLSKWIWPDPKPPIPDPYTLAETELKVERRLKGLREGSVSSVEL
jgi:hypothetical protein